MTATLLQKVISPTIGDYDAIAITSGPLPAIGSTDVLIEVAAAGVSFVDSLVVRGGYQVKPELPFTPGNCLVGRVVARGEDVDIDLVGASVAAVLDGVGGAYSTHVALPADSVAIVPDAVDPARAAAAIESYLTVLFATIHRAPISAGDEVVVLGAGGGIGTAAIDVARAAGAHVIAVASSDEKRAAALANGADVAISYTELKAEIRRASGGGADIVFDPVGGAASEESLRALAPGGRLLIVGFAGGEIPRLPTNQMLLSNRSVIGVDWGDWSRRSGGQARNAALLTRLFTMIADGELNPPAPTRAPLEDAGRILKLIADRAAVGKYVLVPSARAPKEPS
ncbi:NADPH2:quinone reductase [Microbacterium terrae]|uniref:Mycocerosic acid synthase n=1 Tax=Microbacterium terrae TaxID=69369 RepID=A0A0M2H1R9_9MICO|nr:NADPH:quinone oxidoreductase family protein [Microbacterium terrae]KJL37513.1 Mycocerosic acid synthase [Microbacterium terrae]MBP1076342.1 NADPH2:quinone reductase [Microbacterium terrae]GLJ97166.1 NADPH:quinone oxidoreductase [Microbacterium terrae]